MEQLDHTISLNKASYSPYRLSTSSNSFLLQYIKGLRNTDTSLEKLQNSFPCVHRQTRLRGHAEKNMEVSYVHTYVHAYNAVEKKLCRNCSSAYVYTYVEYIHTSSGRYIHMWSGMYIHMRIGFIN